MLAALTRLFGTKGTTHTTGMTGMQYMTGMTEITVSYLQSLGLPLRSLSPPFSQEFLKQKIIQEWYMNMGIKGELRSIHKHPQKKSNMFAHVDGKYKLFCTAYF